jgi:uncharacterized protein (TIGR02145 family)
MVIRNYNTFYLILILRLLLVHKKGNISLLIFIILTRMIFAQPGSITNISAAQRTDGSMLVDIYYDLNGTELPYRISTEASFDGGSSFMIINQVSGNAGEGINPGTGKHIVWNHGAEFPNTFSNTTKIRITAFPTCGILLDDRDGQNYITLLTDAQCWMAENLNIGLMITDEIEMMDNSIIEKYCYDNATTNCDYYGGLYTWYEMMQYSNVPGMQGICPAGWHLPYESEWCSLTQFIDSFVDCDSIVWTGSDIGTKMKSKTGWISGNGTNASGFNVLPDGGCHFDGGFFSQGEYALFWSSEDFYIYGAWCRILKNDKTKITRDIKHREYGFNVRCVKD